MKQGAVMLDVAGLSLTEEDRERLQHPQVGGVILFARNVADWLQVSDLVSEIRAACPRDILVAVDQEGGRVQRFREGFLALPPPRQIGALYDSEPQEAVRLANQLGWAMASEVLATGVDFSFAPVLDLDYACSSVIGDRAWHGDVDAVVALARAYVWGMKRAGMAAVAKHFPGHGFVAADSHVAFPVDERVFLDIAMQDLLPFQALLSWGVEAVMPAHVIYSACDPQPAGFSHFWLQEVLRKRLEFKGVIFSDDLSMEAASVAGDAPERALAAHRAGCDMLLVCNRPDAADAVLARLEAEGCIATRDVYGVMGARKRPDWSLLHAGNDWQGVVSAVDKLNA